MEYYSVLICDEEYLSLEQYEGNGIRLDDLMLHEVVDLIKLTTRSNKRLIVIESYMMNGK